MSSPDPSKPFVRWLRGASPYIHAHRGRTFVVSLGGEAVADPGFPELAGDLALLHGLGVRLVLVHGARPQIEERLQARGAELRLVNGLRVTDAAALVCVKEAAGAVRVEIEALLSMGLPNSPLAGARIRVASGNFVTARPLGVRDGVDHGHTGLVRRVDADAIRERLDDGAIALLPTLGYSPTGEVFNLALTDVASATAVALHADTWIALQEGPDLLDGAGRLISNLTPGEADALLAQPDHQPLASSLRTAAAACRGGVKRVHLVNRKLDGALLLELFTRDGVGTLLSAEPYEDIRAARVEDVGGVLALLRPLEQQGVLVRRSRELLETEIDRFTLMERDGLIVACAALYSYPAERMGELAGLAVHPDYRDGGRGDKLLARIEAQARAQGIERLFVLTTQTAHWFLERGFAAASLDSLPMGKQMLYNYKRNSKAFLKRL